MKTILTIACLSLCLMPLVQAQQESGYEVRPLIAQGDTLPYRLLLPEGFDASRKYPLVLFLPIAAASSATAVSRTR